MADGKQYVVGHLSSVKVHIGDVVHKGDLLALSGNTGNSTAPHLHFGVFNTMGKFIDPCSLNHGYMVTFNFFHDSVASFVNVDVVSAIFHLATLI